MWHVAYLHIYSMYVCLPQCCWQIHVANAASDTYPPYHWLAACLLASWDMLVTRHAKRQLIADKQISSISQNKTGHERKKRSGHASRLSLGLEG